jgi:hypothetical protein
MKIFEVAEGDYYAGCSAEDASAAFRRDIGPESFAEVTEDWESPVEIPEGKWDMLIVVDVDEPGQPTRTFREALGQRNGVPGFIATTNY